MTELLIMAYETETAAFGMRESLVELQRTGFLDAEDMVVATRDAAGGVILHQPLNLTASGALGGTVWGALIGLVFLAPVAGAAIGAGVGALAGAHADIGINDDFMRRAATALPQGGAVLFLLLRRARAAEVLERLRNLGATGRSLSTELPEDMEARLRVAIARAGTTAVSAEEMTAAAAERKRPVIGAGRD